VCLECGIGEIEPGVTHFCVRASSSSGKRITTRGGGKAGIHTTHHPTSTTRCLSCHLLACRLVCCARCGLGLVSECGIQDHFRHPPPLSLVTERLAHGTSFFLVYCAGKKSRPKAKGTREQGCFACLVLSCFFRVHPLGGLFLAHAEAGLHCTVQSITPPWAGCSGLVHLNQSRGVVRLLHMYCPSSLGVAPGPTTSCLPQSAKLQQSSSAVQVGGAMPTMSYLLSMEVIKGECAPFDSYVSLSRHAQSTIGRAQRANLTSALRWTESKQTGKSYGRVRRSKVQYDV